MIAGIESPIKKKSNRTRLVLGETGFVEEWGLAIIFAFGATPA